MGLLSWLLVGLVAGAIARALVPGSRHLGCAGTLALGLLGSLVGGTLGNVVGGDGVDFAAAGLLGSILGAFVVLGAVQLLTSARRG
ncbi:MAG: GlsB/YeaQ/YmgE family stress response membrane protein [Acidimicrobiia bacterium]|nr:GlsB/YeaQ/YmgE family stress response membrane protein [Acidimicrobiia bacterium]